MTIIRTLYCFISFKILHKLNLKPKKSFVILLEHYYYFFTATMAENNRLKLISSVNSAYSKLMSATRGEVLCSVTTAKVCDDDGGDDDSGDDDDNDDDDDSDDDDDDDSGDDDDGGDDDSDDDDDDDDSGDNAADAVRLAWDSNGNDSFLTPPSNYSIVMVMLS